MKKIIYIMLFAMTVVSCSNPKVNVLENAQKEIKSSLSGSQSYKLLYVSKPDSAFGLNYFTQSELKQIQDTVMKVNDILLSRYKSNSINDNEGMESLSRRQAETGLNLVDIEAASNKPKGEWSGWKIRIDYEVADESNEVYRSQRWYFFDKEGKRIQKSFDIALP